MHLNAKRHLGKSLILGMTLLGILMMARGATAVPAAFNWSSNGGGTQTEFGFYEADGNTPLATNDIVQFVWAGPDGTIDPPNLSTGSAGGDDVVLDISIIQNGPPLPPPHQNKGYVANTTFNYDDENAPWNGETEAFVYLRAWNAPDPGNVGGATAYADSFDLINLLADGDGAHNFQTADNGQKAATDSTAVPPEIEVLDGTFKVGDNSGVVNIGATTVGNPVVKTFTVQNVAAAGYDTLDLSGSISVPAGFSVASSFTPSNMVNPGGSVTFQIRLDAGSAGSFSGPLSFDTNDLDEDPFNFTITGQVSVPEVEVIDGSINLADGVSTVDFGNTPQGFPLVRTFQVNNTGSAALNLSNLQVASGSGFSILSGFGASSLAAGQSTTFQVRLDASAAGSPSATISFGNNDSDENPFTFNVVGQVESTAASPNIGVFEGSNPVDDNTGQINFGTTTIPTAVVKTFTVQNSGSAALTLSGLSVPTEFSIVSNFGSTNLAPGALTTFQIRLDAATSANMGLHTGEVSFTTNDSHKNPFNFTVSGAVNDTTSTTAEIQVVDGSVSIPDNTGGISFGTTSIGAPIQKAFTINNIGTGTLELANLIVPDGFNIIEGVGAGIIPPSGSKTIVIELTAASPGSYSGFLSVDNNDSDENPFNFLLSGQVTGASFSADVNVQEGGADIADNLGSVDFGRTTIGQTRSRTFTIQNTGNAHLNISAISVPAGYTVVSNVTSTSLVPSASTSFTVQLDATAVGNFGGQLSFVTNDADENPYNFTITGEVVDILSIYLPFVGK